MSPAAAAMAALLHALVALAFFVESAPARGRGRRTGHRVHGRGEHATGRGPRQPAAPAVRRPAPSPASPRADAERAPGPPPRLGLAPPRSLTPDPTARPAAPQPGPTPTETTGPGGDGRTRRSPSNAEPEPEQQQALPPQPPPPPPPPPSRSWSRPAAHRRPPPPLSAADFPEPPPPAAAEAAARQATAAAPQPQPRAAPPPQRLQPSPLSRAPQQRPPAESQASAQPAPSPLTNPASQYGQRKAKEDYLWRVFAKSLAAPAVRAQRRRTRMARSSLRITVARDGRLLDVGLCADRAATRHSTPPV